MERLGTALQALVMHVSGVEVFGHQIAQTNVNKANGKFREPDISCEERESIGDILLNLHA